MKAFKTLMAGAVVGVLSAILATSAFAAEMSEGKMVLSNTDSYSAAEGQTTVLIVPEAVWEDTDLADLTDEDILYIDQYESAAEATTAIAAGFGVKGGADLADGTYYILLGGKTGTAGAFAITAFECTVGDDGRPIQLGECDGNTAAVNVNDALAVLKHAAGTTTLTGDALIAAECDGNTAAVNVNDALAVLKHAAGTAPLGTIIVK